MTVSQRKPNSPLLSYLRLFRLPNVFTAVADVLMGFLVVQGSFEPTWTADDTIALVIKSFLVVQRSFEPTTALFCAVGASCLLYTAGMVLNDVFDFEVDGRERPHRPLPAGEISVRWARWLGYELLVVGVALGWLAGFADFGLIAIAWRSGVVATLLAMCVVGYNAGLKRTAVGPVVMGACRALNVLLGMSLAPAAAVTGPELLAGFNWPQLVLAGGLGVYVAGITWYARSEAGECSTGQLTAGAAVMGLGIALFGSFPFVGRVAEAGSRMEPGWWCLLLAVPAFTILRRSLAAAMNPSPPAVQAAVKQAILSLIVFDAAATMMVRGPYLALAVLVLLAPTVLLGRWVYAT
jgi:4-hydroxybenzoate polyprenyltransferase